MLILGTGGHIDHGKTSLIEALTGTNTDRLQEEQQRGMTIDLGFASLQLPSGRRLGIIDVPGHHRFVKNMLAGVGGIDLFLLVVAADDGWMPQTQEHMDIVNLLAIERGLTVITKCDLVDEEWLELVTEDVKEHLQGTCLEQGPLVQASSATGSGLDSIVANLDAMAQTVPSPADHGDPLLWIDRVFSVKGAGTVVTGTLTEGSLSVDMEVNIGPKQLSTRIRSLQLHGEDVAAAHPGSRTAVNLLGISPDELQRGMYLHAPGRRPPFDCIDAHLGMLPGAPPLAALQEIKFYRGSLETMARVRLLETDELRGGEEALVQISLDEPAPFGPGDRFVIRHPGQDVTSGGGEFLQEGIPVRGRKLRLVGPRRRERCWPFEANTPTLGLDTLARLRSADPAERALLTAASRPFWTPSQLEARIGSLPPDLIEIGPYVLAPGRWQVLKAHILQSLQDYHQQHPLAPGMSKEEFRSRLQIPQRFLDAVLRNLPEVDETAHVIHLREHSISFTPAQEQLRNKLLTALESAAHEPPTMDQLLEQGYSRDLVRALLFQGELLLVNGTFVVTPSLLEAIEHTVRQAAGDAGFTVADFRDAVGTTRKYALAYLDYFDRSGRTRRDGDLRFWQS